MQLQIRTVIVCVSLVVVGVLVGAMLPSLKAQAATDPCVAPWDVVTGVERDASGTGRSGWSAVKWNRCTGESFVFSTNNHKLDAESVWRKLPTK